MKFDYRTKNCLIDLDWKIPFFVLVYLLLVVQPQEALGECKNVIFLLANQGNYLRNHSIQSVTNATEDLCRITCYMHQSCMSYNYCTRSATCEINDADHYSHPEDLVSKVGSMYVGTDNACSSNPCQGNATCQPNFYTQSYTCLCQPGFSGPYCTDIDECALVSNDCSINHTCINIAGSYDCVCKPGYQAQGITCIDIDECQMNVHNCSADSICVNTIGSFECRCNVGYQMFENKCTKILADYVITVYTASEWLAGTNAKVFIQLHGSQFKEVKTSSKQQLSGNFERGSIDISNINGILPNMELLSQITMSHDGSGSWPGWYFTKVVVDNKTSKIKYTFTCSCKLGWSGSPLSNTLQPARVERY